MQKKSIILFRVLKIVAFIVLSLLLVLIILARANVRRYGNSVLYSVVMYPFLIGFSVYLFSVPIINYRQLYEMKKAFLAQIPAFQDAAKFFEVQAKENAAFPLQSSISELFVSLTNTLQSEYASKFSTDEPNASVEMLPSGAVMIHIAFPRCRHWRFLYVPKECTVREVKVYLAMQKKLGEGWYAIRL